MKRDLSPAHHKSHTGTYWDIGEDVVTSHILGTLQGK